MLKKKNQILRRGQRVSKLGVRNIKKQESGFSVGQPILIWAHVRNPVADGIF